MKVYLITSGRYSDYHIRSISIDREEAERMCAVFNNQILDKIPSSYNMCMQYRDYAGSDAYHIEEYDTEKMKIEVKGQIKERYLMEIYYDTGELVDFAGGCAVFTKKNRIFVEKSRDHKKKVVKIIATLPQGTGEKKAKKIMLDRFAEFKAKKANIHAGFDAKH